MMANKYGRLYHLKQCLKARDVDLLVDYLNPRGQSSSIAFHAVDIQISLGRPCPICGISKSYLVWGWTNYGPLLDGCTNCFCICLGCFRKHVHRRSAWNIPLLYMTDEELVGYSMTRSKRGNTN